MSTLFSFNSFADEVIVTEEPTFDCEVTVIINGVYLANSPLEDNTQYVLTNVGVWENLSNKNEVYSTLNRGDIVHCVSSSDDSTYTKIKIEDKYYYTLSEALGTKEELDNIIKTEQENQFLTKYPAANYIWNYLIDNGYSEAAAAGILGNMMVEVGGWIDNIATMNLDVTNNGKVYYGLCQWKKSLYPEVVGMNLQQQLDFLLETIGTEFEDFGRLSGYSLESFKNATDPSSAGLAFAKTYERCGSSSFKRRQRCAVVAYEYFT